MVQARLCENFHIIFSLSVEAQDRPRYNHRLNSSFNAGSHQYALLVCRDLQTETIMHELHVNTEDCFDTGSNGWSAGGILKSS